MQTRLTSLTTQRAAKQTHRAAIPNTPQLGNCFQLPRACRRRAARRIRSQRNTTHAVACSRPGVARYKYNASQRTSNHHRSVRSMVLRANPQTKHGGADQVQYALALLLKITGFDSPLFPTGCHCDLWRHGPCGNSQSYLLCAGSTLCSKPQLASCTASTSLLQSADQQ